MIPTIDQLSRGEVGNVGKVLDTICNSKDAMRKQWDFPGGAGYQPTMKEMCIKYGESFIAVLKRNQEMKRLHAENGHGYWLGKNEWRARWTAEIPVQIAGNPRNQLYWQYFNPGMTDASERRKHLYAFLRKYDMAFSMVDKL